MWRWDQGRHVPFTSRGGMRREEGVSKGKDPGYLDLKAGPTLGLKAEHRVMPGTQVRLKMEP